MALWTFGPLAITDFIDTGQMPADVLAEAACQVIDAFFFDQSTKKMVENANMLAPDIQNNTIKK